MITSCSQASDLETETGDCAASKRRAGQRVLSLPLPEPTIHGRPTLVLDLDATLIGSIRTRPRSSSRTRRPTTDDGAAASCTVAAAAVATAPYRRMPDYAHAKHQVWLRPGAKEFLLAVRPHFEVVLFTAANEEWALTALRQLDPDATLFDKL
jgi:hypothetical protein